ncbi:hypothetical protein VOLCADRAFT_105688, partial [Volvox carteri f. nagariensis]
MPKTLFTASSLERMGSILTDIFSPAARESLDASQKAGQTTPLSYSIPMMCNKCPIGVPLLCLQRRVGSIACLILIAITLAMIVVVAVVVPICSVFGCAMPRHQVKPQCIIATSQSTGTFWGSTPPKTMIHPSCRSIASILFHTYDRRVGSIACLILIAITLAMIVVVAVVVPICSVFGCAMPRHQHAPGMDAIRVEPAGGADDSAGASLAPTPSVLLQQSTSPTAVTLPINCHTCRASYRPVRMQAAKPGPVATANPNSDATTVLAFEAQLRVNLTANSSACVCRLCRDTNSPGRLSELEEAMGKILKQVGADAAAVKVGDSGQLSSRRHRALVTATDFGSGGGGVGGDKAVLSMTMRFNVTCPGAAEEQLGAIQAALVNGTYSVDKDSRPVIENVLQRTVQNIANSSAGLELNARPILRRMRVPEIQMSAVAAVARAEWRCGSAWSEKTERKEHCDEAVNADRGYPARHERFFGFSSKACFVLIATLLPMAAVVAVIAPLCSVLSCGAPRNQNPQSPATTATAYASSVALEALLQVHWPQSPTATVSGLCRDTDSPERRQLLSRFEGAMQAALGDLGIDMQIVRLLSAKCVGVTGVEDPAGSETPLL